MEIGKEAEDTMTVERTCVTMEEGTMAMEEEEILTEDIEVMDIREAGTRLEAEDTMRMETAEAMAQASDQTIHGMRDIMSLETLSQEATGIPDMRQIV